MRKQATQQHSQPQHKPQAWRMQSLATGQNGTLLAYGDLSQQRPRLVRLCAKLSSDHEAAEDLAQETLLEAWRHAHTLRDPSAWPAWLSGVARNVCLRWQR